MCSQHIPLATGEPVTTPTSVVDRHQQSVRLDAGDAYARIRFAGPRRPYRALGEPSFTLTDGFAADVQGGRPQSALEKA